MTGPRIPLQIRALGAALHAPDLGVDAPRRRTVLVSLRTGPLTPDQVRALLPGVHRAAVNRVMVGLIEEGLVSRLGSGSRSRRYRLTAHGRARL